MSKKSKSGYVFNGKTNDNDSNKQSKRITKSQAQTGGSTVDKPKRHLNIFGGDANKEKLDLVDHALHNSIKADVKFVRTQGGKVQRAQDTQDFFDGIKANGGVRASIGNAFSNAAAAISSRMDEHRAKIQSRDKRYSDARKAARKVWTEGVNLSKAEKAVMH